jgi:hypothetical protein
VSFLGAFTADLVDLEFGPQPQAVRAGAQEWVQTRIAGAGDVTRRGLRVAALALAGGVRLRTGHAYEGLPDAERRAIAERIAASSLPIVAEFVKAVRSLAVAYVYDA